MKILIFIICILNISFLKADVIDELRLASNAKENETLVIFHYNIVSCVKCDIEPNEILTNLKNHKIFNKLKIIATVICDRDIELKIFAKDKQWKYSMYRNDGSLLSKLQAPPGTIITVINAKNEKFHIKAGNSKSNFTKIIDFIAE